MRENNKSCLVCKKKYTYCSSCEEYAHLPRWMTSFCGENCHEVFDIISLYEDKHISLEETKKKLDACDLSVIRANKTPTSRIIADIYRTVENKVNVIETELLPKTCKKTKKEL